MRVHNVVYAESMNINNHYTGTLIYEIYEIMRETGHARIDAPGQKFKSSFPSSITHYCWSHAPSLLANNYKHWFRMQEVWVMSQSLHIFRFNTKSSM